MYISFLFAITAVIAFVAYRNSKLKLLSPTFWASVMVCAFSAIYVLTYSTMLNDISLKSFVVILGGIVCTALGSYIGNNTLIRTSRFPKSKSCGIKPFQYTDSIIVIDKWKTLIITLIYSYIAVVRFRNLLAMAGGSFLGFFDAMTQSRYALVASKEDVILSNVYLNQLLYACEIAVYIHIFVFLYNLLIAKKKKYYLLLPLIPDFLARLATTSRSSFLVLLFGFASCYFFILVKQNRCKRIFITPKIIIIVSIVLVIFFAYGRVRNNLEISILDNVQMYSSASIYNFDYYLREGWTPNPYFGYYTLQKVYSLIGIQHAGKLRRMPMIMFNTHGARANIFTSYFQTVQDYGILGMLILRFFEAILGTFIIRTVLKEDIDKYKLYYLLYFLIITLYAYFNFPIGNRFGDYLGNPTVIMRYFVYGYLLVDFYLKPRLSKC